MKFILIPANSLIFDVICKHCTKMYIQGTFENEYFTTDEYHEINMCESWIKF